MEEEPAHAPAVPQGSTLLLAKVNGIASCVEWSRTCMRMLLGGALQVPKGAQGI